MASREVRVVELRFKDAEEVLELLGLDQFAQGSGLVHLRGVVLEVVQVVVDLLDDLLSARSEELPRAPDPLDVL